ncbi:biopolymer transporter ExbD [Hymenobacter negativus]|uniref:Biopolymer transporter ExbD n=1 Tax=Hymenobacter negativus TaxID=2795026 RepID=A0ABS3QCC5_9BACT|nr:biopolymer transporter ExbD [Hymenobacter negativus]MBO2008900.1 biopolymer transporter ExbD [Hymenobacter negativus]
MTFVKSENKLRRSRGASSPDMTPFAGVVFLIVCFYAITTQFKGPRIGNAALEELPYHSGSGCLPENNEAVIGLDTDGHYSFSVSGPLFQSITIQKVAAKQSVIFSASQRSKLNQIEYIDVDIRALPAILEEQSNNHLALLIKEHYPLGEEQLLACSMTSKKVIQTLVHKPSYVALLINAETSASKVMHLIELLQNQGINRFNLKLQDGSQQASRH